jgi:flagellar biogenesis protein FliO
MSILRNFSSNSQVVPNLGSTNRLGTLLRRFFSGFGRRSVVGGALEHLGSLPLTANSSLALVRLHKETLLLGITSSSITLLSKSNEEVGFGLASITPDPVKSDEPRLLATGGAAR